jgi:hypothetical protein
MVSNVGLHEPISKFVLNIAINTMYDVIRPFTAHSHFPFPYCSSFIITSKKKRKEAKEIGLNPTKAEVGLRIHTM